MIELPVCTSLHCDSMFQISLTTASRRAQAGCKLFMRDVVRFTSVRDGPKRVSGVEGQNGGVFEKE